MLFIIARHGLYSAEVPLSHTFIQYKYGSHEHGRKCLDQISYLTSFAWEIWILITRRLSMLNVSSLFGHDST